MIIVYFFITLLFVISCNKPDNKAMHQKIIIEFQHFEGCPNGPKLHNNLLLAIKGIEDKVEVSEININTPELAKKHNFRGSPTILINNIDLLGMEQPKEPALNCRIYPNGLPTPDFIRNAIYKEIEKMNK